MSQTHLPALPGSRTARIAAAVALCTACSGGGGEPVGPLPVTRVDVTAPSTTFEVGQAVQFQAFPKDRNGNAVGSAVISWTVAPASVASVNATGLVTAKSAGTATVTATAGAVAGSAGVTINDSGIPLITTVSMPGNAFSPFNVIVRIRGTVNFDFPSEPHDVVFGPVTGAPANIPVTTRTVVPRVFNTAGTFPYDCRVHPGMSGQVTVVP